MSARIGQDFCPTCGTPVRIISAEDGTSYYQLDAAPALPAGPELRVADAALDVRAALGALLNAAERVGAVSHYTKIGRAAYDKTRWLTEYDPAALIAGEAALPAGLPDVERLAAALRELVAAHDKCIDSACTLKTQPGDEIRGFLAALEGSATPEETPELSCLGCGLVREPSTWDAQSHAYLCVECVGAIRWRKDEALVADTLSRNEATPSRELPFAVNPQAEKRIAAARELVRYDAEVSTGRSQGGMAERIAAIAVALGAIDHRELEALATIISDQLTEECPYPNECGGYTDHGNQAHRIARRILSEPSDRGREP